ncbi:MAG TPA: PAS domain S-box protein [Anaerolineales bacterium]|nr:PAS domain S-box protein [Anaerolineales bacterium]
MNVPLRQSTRGRLLLLVFLVVVPAFLVQLYGAWSDLQQDIATRKQDAGRIIIRAQGNFQTLLDTSRTVFTELIRLNTMRAPHNCTQVFSQLNLAYERLAPDATNIGLSDAEGNIYCAINTVVGQKNIADQPHFVRATSSLDMAVGDYSLNPSTGVPTLSIAYPVLSFDGKVETVIFITYELRWIEDWQKQEALPVGTAVTLVSPKGEILERYDNGAREGSESSAIQATWYAALQDGRNGLEAPDVDGVTRLHTLAPLRSGSETAAWLHLGYPVAEIYAEARQALAWRLALLGIVFVTALGLAWWGSELLFLHPLKDLMSVVARVHQGDLTARVSSIPAVGELTGLAQAFDRMTESLQQRESARQQAQEGLSKANARFQAIFDNVAVGVAVMGLDRKPIAFNAAAEQIIGYAAEEIKGIDPRTLAVPEDRGIDAALFPELIEGKRDTYVMERRYYRKDGRVFWARINYSLVRDLEGKPDYLIGLIEDIDEQKRAAERLAEQEADYLLTLKQRVEERTHELEEANRRLQQEIEQRLLVEGELARRAAEEAVTADRTRLARDLHDAVTQTLFSASLTAEVLPDLWDMDLEEAKRSTEELRQLTRGALAEMRTLLLELRPATLTQTRLNDLIKQLCEAFIGRSRLPITLTIEGECQLPPEVQIAFYRVAQETLNNVFKYAHATQVDVKLFLSPSSVHLETRDNGVGFDMSTAKPTSLGMRIMRERAEAIGADLHISSQPGSGTCIEMTWHENPNLG